MDASKRPYVLGDSLDLATYKACESLFTSKLLAGPSDTFGGVHVHIKAANEDELALS
jgi:hypothetical protein